VLWVKQNPLVVSKGETRRGLDLFRGNPLDCIFLKGNDSETNTRIPLLIPAIMPEPSLSVIRLANESNHRVVRVGISDAAESHNITAFKLEGHYR